MKTCDKPEWEHCFWSLPLWSKKEPGPHIECLAENEPCPFEEKEMPCEGCGELCEFGLCRACYERDLWDSYMSMVY